MGKNINGDTVVFCSSVFAKPKKLDLGVKCSELVMESHRF